MQSGAEPKISTADTKILVIEDELITAQHLKQSLIRLGYQVIGTASSAAAALEIAQQKVPDLALADIGLRGEMDGIQLAERLQQRWEVPTIYLTALADKETIQRAQQTEPYGYIVKPFSVEDLHATIEIALHRKALFRQRTRASEANARLLERTKEDLYHLAASLVTAQEDERRRIAQDLHDDLGQRVALLQIELEQLLPSMDQTEDVGRIRTAIDQISALSDQIRNISHGLHPAVLEDLGLPVALRQLTTEFERRHATPTRLSVRGVPSSIPQQTALCLYRIVQEALTNIAKHASAATVEVALACERDLLTLIVRDSGQGFDPGALKNRGGLGLISMRQRAELAGGTLEVQSHPGRGTKITVSVPLWPPARPADDVSVAEPLSSLAASRQRAAQVSDGNPPDAAYGPSR